MLGTDEQPRKAVALMRERLMEVLKGFSYECRKPCGKPSLDSLTENIKDCNECKLGQLADYLLENGVIVPPCKVGDTVYVVDKGLDVWWKGEVSSVGYVDQNNIQIGVIYDDGEVAICDADTVFLTKEEVEAALRKEDEGK